MEMNFEQLCNKLVDDGFVTKSELDKAIADVTPRLIESRQGSGFSIIRAIRGLKAMGGQNEAVKVNAGPDDIAYAQKALSTSATTGSYLIPTIQSAEIIQILISASVLRSMKPTVWPMRGIQKLTVVNPSAVQTFEWLGQNTQQSASDPTFAQLSFDLKTGRALTVIPNELLRASVPEAEGLVTMLLGKAFGKGEDVAFFSTTTVSNGPTSVYAAASTGSVNAANSANGGTVTYADLIRTMETALTAAAEGPFIWAMHPRSFFSGGVLNILDSQSRPIVQPMASTNGVQYSLFGFPVFLSPNIPINQTLGSGTSKSFVLFTNPNYLHIADGGDIEIAISTEFRFDFNQTAVRGVRYLDYGFAPAGGITILKGVS